MICRGVGELEYFQVVHYYVEHGRKHGALSGVVLDPYERHSLQSPGWGAIGPLRFPVMFAFSFLLASSSFHCLSALHRNRPSALYLGPGDRCILSVSLLLLQLRNRSWFLDQEPGDFVFFFSVFSARFYFRCFQFTIPLSRTNDSIGFY